MPKLMNWVNEYFLGTETRKHYQREINFYREFSDEITDTTKTRELTRKEEKYTLFIGKTVPNLIDLVAIAYSLITRAPPYLLIWGESIRLGCAITMKKRRKEDELQRKLLQEKWLRIRDTDERIRTLEDLSNNLRKLHDRLDDIARSTGE